MSLCAIAVGLILSGTVVPLPRGDFPDPRPYKAHYRCGWAAVTAGEIEASVAPHPSGTLEMSAKGGTIGAVRALWGMDFLARSVLNTKTLHCRQSQMRENYRQKMLLTYLRFGEDEVRRLRQPIPADKTPALWKKFVYPGITDLFGGLLTVRSQKLDPGDVYDLVVYSQTAAYLAAAKVVGHETLVLNETRRETIRLDLKLQKLSKKGQIEPYNSYKEGSVWLSNDADRVIVRAKAEIFVGSVWVELTSLEHPAPSVPQRTQMPR